VSRVIGPVVDVEFPADAMPEIYNALHVERSLGGTTSILTLEVAQHIGDNLDPHRSVPEPFAIGLHVDR
jgi:F-type H+-transporting ATPase subunit beta